MATEFTFERVERHLYRHRYLMRNGQWSVNYVAVFRDHTGKDRRIKLSHDLKTARQLLKELEVRNDKKEDLDAEKKAKQQRQELMTLSKWAAIYQGLPEVKQKRSVDRDIQMLKHLTRHLGDKPLTEIRRENLFNYIEKRRGETLFRCGDWTTVPVKDGTIRNELAILRHVLNVARSREIETSNVSFENVLPDATTRQRTLKSDERKRLLEASPVWLRRLLLTAMETALSEGDLIRLELDDVDWDEGVIVPGGGRKKTHVRQAAPLTAVVRALFEEMKHEYRQAKVKNLSTACLVFTKDGKPISANMIHKAIRKACKTASVKDFRFHDTRHIAKTAWARAESRLKLRC